VASPELLRAMNFFIDEDFLDPPSCERFITAMRAAPAVPARVALERPDNLTVADDLRRTMRIEAPAEVTAELMSALDAVRGETARHFGVTLTRTEDPQFLRYRTGDFYVRHTDRDREGVNQRAVSVIIFLNSPGDRTFRGGNLKFYGSLAGKPLAFDVPPRQGLLVAFRSEFLHEVEKVTAGERLTAVTWFS
jgi:SM-20-related protein